jgi:ribosomal protein L19E
LSSKDDEGQEVIVYNRNGDDKKNANQRWKILYLDQKEKDRTSGENKEFGFHINRPFYLKSRLPMGRVAECIGASRFQIKTYRANQAVQQFYFHEVSKTIRSNHWKNYCL